MSKYNVGDVVKLRDDLEDRKLYGGTDYCKEMDIMKNKPIQILRIPEICGNCYCVVDETGKSWFITDKMIEGLWKECRPAEQVRGQIEAN